MAVISDVMRGPFGDIQTNVIITMRALGTTARVLVENSSSVVTDSAGKYSMTVFPGEYEVSVSTLGVVGTIKVLTNSVNGTLNDFLIEPAKPDELTPEVVRTVDTMRLEAAGSAAAAKTSENNAAAAMTNAVSKVATTDQSVASTLILTKPVRLSSASNATGFMPNTPGAWVAWNRKTATDDAISGGTDFINHKGTFTGGWNFWSTDGEVINLSAKINWDGSIRTMGGIVSHTDQIMQAGSVTSNLLLRFKDKDGVEKGSVYSQTDTGSMNIRWNGAANTASFRADGFVTLSNGLMLNNAFTTAASIPDTGTLPIIFRGASLAGLSAPNSITIGTNSGFAVVPLADTGLAEGVTRGVPVFSVSATSGITYVLKDLKIGSGTGTSVLKVGDYGMGGGAVSMGSTLSIDDNTLPSGNYYANSATTGVKPEGSYGHLTVIREGSNGLSVRQMWNANSSADLWVRIYINSAWSAWRKTWNSLNTTVDANGFIKKASPIVKLFGDGSSELNEQSQGVTTERIDEGVYRVSGVLGFNGDGAWGGAGNGIEIPVDDNKRALVWVESKILPDGDIEIRTYHRTYDTGPYSARNIAVMDSGEVYKKNPIYVMMPDGTPVDIPAGRWIDLRVEMPASDEPEPQPEVAPESEVVPETDTTRQPEPETEQQPVIELGADSGTEPVPEDNQAGETKE